MTAIARTESRASSLLLPGLLLCGLTAVVLGQIGVLQIPSRIEASVAAPEVVTVPEHDFAFRSSGDFLRDGRPVDGPVLQIAAHPALEVMKYQVSATDYARCAAAKACKRAEPRRQGIGDVPATGVSFNDATAYARWLSGETGEIWRLPTMEEWAFAAGSKEIDHPLDGGSDAANPSERWLLAYDRETAAGRQGPATPAAKGGFGLNEFGVVDLAGTVWEWTSTCASRTTLASDSAVVSRIDSCRIHYLEGRHRAPINDFIRDAQGGGCGGGKPPDNLGFRLVHDREWLMTFVGALRSVLHV